MASISYSSLPSGVMDVLINHYLDYPKHVLVPIEMFGFNINEHVLARTYLEIERAVGITKLSTQITSKQVTDVIKKGVLMSAHRNDQFVFWIAGGWVLERIMHVDGASDMDVWFEPVYRKRDQNLLLCNSKSCYPCDLHMVNDAQLTIEGFDLHICQIAIKVVMTKYGRSYSTHATGNFARAFRLNLAILSRPHPVIAFKSRLQQRLLKYLERGIMVPDFLRQTLRSSAAEKPMRFRGCFSDIPCLQASKPAWKVVFRGNHLSSCTFTMEKDLPLGILKSSPMVLHTCNTMINEVAYMSGQRHWMLRMLASTEESCLQVKGWYRMNSCYFKPRWFADKLHWSAKDLKAALAEQCPRLNGGYAEAYLIECTWPTTVLMRQSNFKKISSYDPGWFYIVTPMQDTCDSLRICCATGLFGECVHASLVSEVRFSPCCNAELLTTWPIEDNPSEDIEDDYDSSD